MTNQEVYKLLIKIDAGYSPSTEEKVQLSSIERIKWRGISQLPKSIGMLSRLMNLDLDNTAVNDISALSGLTELTNLDLSNTLINDISVLSGLTELKTLNLRNTYVSDIHALSGLTELTKLDLGLSRVFDISALSGLTELKTLNLRNTYVSDIHALSGLTGLINLDLNLTGVTDIRVLSGLTGLTYLTLTFTKVVDISALSGLTGLTYLDLSNTFVTDINVLSGLTELKTLNSRNTYVSDIHALSGLTELTKLDLRGTRVSDISALSGLTNLTELDLRNLIISSIPESFLDLGLDFIPEKNPTGPGIYIYGLTLTDQPVEIFSQDKALIRSYYREHDRVPVNECKVIFLGDAEAGKTHSIKRLLRKGEILNEFENQSTSGIEITVHTMQLDDSDIVINYWDFGGQEIQHSMHRMFMTERTIYVVFLNARQDPLDERARYWLENICSFAPDAPVLLVINKIDQNKSPKFNEAGIRNEYGSRIKKIVRMSALKDKPKDFMEKLQGSINEIIREMPTVSAKIPLSWKNLMDKIRTMKDHYLTTKQFKELCNACNVQDYNTLHNDLVDLFQIIGISFCYYKNRSLADYMLLEPKWLVNAIYTIIFNSKAASHNGVITQVDLYNLLKEDILHGETIRRVIPDLRYESYQVNYILGVIRMFNLSYPMKDGAEFFPMLCDSNEKISIDKAITGNALHYIFRYTYLPANVMHQLVVELQRDLDERYVWYSGAVFLNEYQKQKAYIHTKGNDLHIYVEALDPYYNPNEYLTPIQSIVRAINTDMNLSAKEYMTFKEGNIEAEIAETILRGNLKNGIERGYVDGLGVIDYKDVARRYNDIRPKIKGNLLQNILKALGLMQNEKAYYKTPHNSDELEDLRNRYVSSHILMAGYICNDQQSGGRSGSGRRTGERDIVFRNKNGQDVLIYEGLNLTGLSKKNIDDHIHKLMENYNPQGLPYGVLASYVDCERTRFDEITNMYRSHIADHSPKDFVCVGQPRNIPTIGQYLRCLEMDYECASQHFTIYHILVAMVEQM